LQTISAKLFGFNGLSLLLSRLRLRFGRLVGPVLVCLALLSLLAAPATWAAVSVQGGNGGAWLTDAGPANSMSGGRVGNFAPGGQAGGFAPGGSQVGTTQQRGASQGVPGQGSTNTQRPTGNAGQQGTAGAFPEAGGNRGGGGSGQALTFAGAQWNNLDARLVQYLIANQGSAAFLVATPTPSYAHIFMLATDQPALALGGYQGWDRALTPDQLTAWVRAGTVRFFYLNGTSGTGKGGTTTTGRVTNSATGASVNVASLDVTADLSVWVQSSCTIVPTATWQESGTTTTTSTVTQGQQLYDCSVAATK